MWCLFKVLGVDLGRVEISPLARLDARSAVCSLNPAHRFGVFLPSRLAAQNGFPERWDVKRLYVGDGSLVPRTLSVNPSLTIMALADRLVDHIDRSL